MKTILISTILLSGLFTVFQIYISMATNKAEKQAYRVIRLEDKFEIRYYPAATMAVISSHIKSYRDLGTSGFGTLAKYIFGANSEKKQIPMTSPVHMEIGDSISTMAFVMPSNLNFENLPTPYNSDIVIETSKPEYVAAITFHGFANTNSINKNKIMLESAIKKAGLSYYGNFRYLGYNPPYQLIGRRNEVIVALNDENFTK